MAVTHRFLTWSLVAQPADGDSMTRNDHPDRGPPSWRAIELKLDVQLTGPLPHRNQSQAAMRSSPPRHRRCFPAAWHRPPSASGGRDRATQILCLRSSMMALIRPRTCSCRVLFCQLSSRVAVPDPESSVRSAEQGIDGRAEWERVPRRHPRDEANAVVLDESRTGTNPEISIGGLRDRVRRGVETAVLHAPRRVAILGQSNVGIEGSGRYGRQHECDRHCSCRLTDAQAHSANWCQHSRIKCVARQQRVGSIDVIRYQSYWRCACAHPL